MALRPAVATVVVIMEEGGMEVETAVVVMGEVVVTDPQATHKA